MIDFNFNLRRYSTVMGGELDAAQARFARMRGMGLQLSIFSLNPSRRIRGASHYVEPPRLSGGRS
jgi:hypothetical protein